MKKSYYEKSLYKHNILNLLNDESLISFLNKKNIDLIYIPHHNELYLKKRYDQSNFIYAKIEEQIKLTKYIKKCSLLITDISSVSFAFMFKHKPVLFYFLDYNDTAIMNEKISITPRNKLFFGNIFLEKNSLIRKIKLYIKRKFKINKKLKNHYNSVFYYRSNICQRIASIIHQIIIK